MGNSESFDLIDIPENPPNTKHKHKHQSKKKPSHHHHSQTISSSLKSITSFDLNGIFRKINEEQNNYHPDKKSAAIKIAEVIASAPPQPEPDAEPTAEESTRPLSCTDTSESESTNSNYVESKIQEIESMAVPEKRLISVTLTKGVDNSAESESTPKSDETESEKPSSVEAVKEVGAFIVDEIENEDIINLDKDESQVEPQQKADIELQTELEPVEVDTEMEAAEAVDVTVKTVEYESEVAVEIKTEEQVEAESESMNKQDQEGEEEEGAEEVVNKCTI